MGPGTRTEGEHHMLHVYLAPDGGHTEYDLFHPGGCARTSGVCWIEDQAANIGWDEIFDGFEPGFHRIVPFAIEGGWVTGDYAIEWDWGVEDAGEPGDWWEAGRPDPAEWEPFSSWSAVEEWAWRQSFDVRPMTIGDGF